MKLFLCHASEDQAVATKVRHALENAGHKVFFSPTHPKAGGDFIRRIREELDESEGFIFLISPDSVRKEWPRTELKFAKERWERALGHVLPVELKHTNKDEIDDYLKSVDIVPVEGDAAAEVVDAVEKWQSAIAAGEVKSGGTSLFGKFLRGLVAELQQPQSSLRESSPAMADPLAQLLPGAWQIQLTYPNRMTGQATAEIYANGYFRAQGRSPAIPMFQIEGKWQILQSDQILLAGQQSDGYRAMPFNATVQFLQTTANMLTGSMSTGEQVVWRRVA